LVNLHLLKATLPIALLVVLGACGDDNETSPGADSGGTPNSAPVIVGTLFKIGAVTANTYIDRTPLNTKVYAYRVSPTQSVVRNRVYSNVAFDQPRRPAGLMASFEGTNLVKLRWDKAIEPDVAGCNVYRARGSDVRVEGAGRK
jgi:hypothetical protein